MSAYGDISLYLFDPHKPVIILITHFMWCRRRGLFEVGNSSHLSPLSLHHPHCVWLIIILYPFLIQLNGKACSPFSCHKSFESAWCQIYTQHSDRRLDLDLVISYNNANSRFLRCMVTSPNRKDIADTLVTSENAVVDIIADAVFLVVNLHNLHESDYKLSPIFIHYTYNRTQAGMPLELLWQKESSKDVIESFGVKEGSKPHLILIRTVLLFEAAMSLGWKKRSLWIKLQGRV